MNYATIKPWDIANGPGVRVSASSSPAARTAAKTALTPRRGTSTTASRSTEAVMEHGFWCRLAQPDYIRGVTYLGGEPFDPRNQAGLLELYAEAPRGLSCRSPSGRSRAMSTEKTCRRCPGVTDALLASLDVLVDGPFIEEQKNLRLRFRGSENQRLIDMPQTLKAGTVVLWDEEQ